MANWCSYSARIISDDSDELKSLYDLMKRLEEMETPLVENGFGNAWFGCLVTALGGDWEKISCRGDWECLEFDGKVLSFEADCAWYRFPDLEEFILKKFPSLKLYYYCEEPGMGIYETNDKDGVFFKARFMLDIYDDDIYYLETEDEVLDLLNKKFLKELKTMDEVTDFIVSYNEESENAGSDRYIWMNQIEVAE